MRWGFLRARRGVRVGVACAALAFIGTWAAFTCGRPDPATVPSYDEVRGAHRPSDVQLLDRHGAVVHELRTDPHRRALAWVPLDEVSPLLRDAIVAAEDRRFERHGGVDALAVLGALRDRLLGRAPRGASTITMQLAKLLDARAGIPHRRSLAGKLRQMRRAWALEERWSKEQILEAYLNLVTFRGEVQGVGAASAVLLGKRPHGISQAEALVLAVLPRAPNAAGERVVARATLLARRLGAGVDETSLAQVARTALDPDRAAGVRVALAPHLATRLLRGNDGSRNAPVRTTLDRELQRAAARALEEHLRELAGRNVRDGAVLVVDNQSGEVLAYVGGRGANASAPHVDAVRARRQAGSTLKPFLYATALELRLLTAASLLDDAPLALPVAGGLYQPRNYDEAFRGLVSLRSALASSLNVPAVRALQLVSADALLARLRALGFSGLRHDGEFYGPSLALGSAEVSLEELVNAYRALANGGVASPLRFVADGDLRQATNESAAEASRVFGAEATFVVADVLADRDGRSATFGLESALATRRWSAVKTGTSKEMRDNWCIGFSRRFTVGVWVGNASGEPMHDVSGLSGAAPVWRELMELLAEREADAGPPAPPDGVQRARVDFPGGVEPSRDEWFLRGTEPGAGGHARAARRPRIVSPQPGTVIALDPDIPEHLQRLAFEADGVRARAGAAEGADGAAEHALGPRWRLDGRELPWRAASLLWQPIPGRHRLELLDPDGRTLDAVEFEVRGGRAVARDATAEHAAPVASPIDSVFDRS
ncbi:MAG TPA: penicillin-binding protein 1C [Candidatus Binatia bacterium]